jgi:HSP20 family molecular chaperone IbpA
MNEDPRDIFDQMDAMMAQMFADMNRGIAGIPTNAVGYRIFIQGGGMPQDPLGGRISRTCNPHEPVPEVHRIGNEVKVVAELPGADSTTINLDLKGETLAINADGMGQHYATTAALPPVDPASMHHSFKNGVLEVTFGLLSS